MRAWAALDEGRQESFRSQVTALAEERDRGADGSLAVPSKHLEVVAHRTD